MTLKKQIAELTEEVRRLREEVAALRLRQPVQFVPYIPWTPPFYGPYIYGPGGTEIPVNPLPVVTITCNAEGPS